MSNQTPAAETVQEFVSAAHSDLVKVKEMLAEQPALLDMAHEWRPGDTETALQAAAHVGNRAVVEYLLAQGAPLDICAAAMLGRKADVVRFIQTDSANVQARGAHGIPLMTYAALGANTELVQYLLENGASEGASAGLSMAVRKGDLEMARFLLEKANPDLAWQNFQDKTVMEIAEDSGQAEMVALLKRNE